MLVLQARKTAPGSYFRIGGHHFAAYSKIDRRHSRVNCIFSAMAHPAARAVVHIRCWGRGSRAAGDACAATCFGGPVTTGTAAGAPARTSRQLWLRLHRLRCDGSPKASTTPLRRHGARRPAAVPHALMTPPALRRRRPASTCQGVNAAFCAGPARLPSRRARLCEKSIFTARSAELGMTLKNVGTRPG